MRAKCTRDVSSHEAARGARVRELVSDVERCIKAGVGAKRRVEG